MAARTSRAGRCSSRGPDGSSRESLTLQALLALMLMSPLEARALQATLTVTNAPATLSVPIAADYNAGFVAGLIGISFTVDITAGGNNNRTTIVSIRSSSPTMGGTKAVGDLQWRRADLGTWNSLTTSNVVVQSRTPYKRT